MTIPRLITVRMAAAVFGRPPRSLASQAKTGYSATASTTLQARIGTNGRMSTKVQIDQHGQQSEPDRKLDDVLSGQKLAKSFQGRAFI